MMRITNVFQVLVLMLISLSSCAIVTVNVYFPAEEVQEAYRSLEEELLQPPQEEAPETEQAPQSKPQSLRNYPEEPQLISRRLIVLKRRSQINIGIPAAWAQGNLAGQIANELRKMPEVMEAFQGRRQRLGDLSNLLSQGKVGEGNEGLLVKRGDLTGAETAIVKAENVDRETIMRGMAKAIVKINQLDMTPENIDRVYPQAAEQFAEVRREEAEPGWWIQLSNGEWIKK
jgi:uncharacterized protein YdbL (DUF1318 family)